MFCAEIEWRPWIVVLIRCHDEDDSRGSQANPHRAPLIGWIWHEALLFISSARRRYRFIKKEVFGRQKQLLQSFWQQTKIRVGHHYRFHN
jgi:hypothetical protein